MVEMCVSVSCKTQNKRNEFVEMLYVFTTLSKEYLLKIIRFLLCRSSTQFETHIRRYSHGPRVFGNETQRRLVVVKG